MTARGPLFGAAVADPPAHVGRDTARRVIPLFRPYRAQVAFVVGLIVVTSTVGIVNPLLIQAVFNKALFVPGGPDLHLLYVLVAIMAAVPIVNGAIGILQTYETTRVGQHVMRDLRDRLYSHLETLSLAFFTNTKTGEIQSRLANDVGGVQSVVTTTASTILANVVTFVSSIVAMIILSWQLTIVSVFTVPAFFWLTKTVGQRRRRVSRSTQESLAAMSALTEETLSVSGVLLAKVFGNQARDIGRYRRESQQLSDFQVRQQMMLVIGSNKRSVWRVKPLLIPGSRGNTSINANRHVGTGLLRHLPQKAVEFRLGSVGYRATVLRQDKDLNSLRGQWLHLLGITLKYHLFLPRGSGL